MSNDGENKKRNNDDLYNVEEILDRKQVGRTHHYLIKWEGYSKKYSTWEPKRHLLRVSDMIKEFQDKRKCEGNKKKVEIKGKMLIYCS